MRAAGLVFTIFFLCASIAQAATPTQNREWFEQARLALNKSDERAFKLLRAQLENYPLTPYLDIWLARKALKKGNDGLVEQTLIQHANIPESRNLRIAWLKYLAKHGEWEQVIKLFDAHPEDRARLPETAMVATWHSGKSEQAIALFSSHWIKDKKISTFTEKLRQNWKKAGHPTLNERWQRIGNYARHGKWKKIKREALHLPKETQPLITYWHQVQNEPVMMLNQWPENIDPLTAELILNDGLIRLARSDAGKAWHLLLQLSPKVTIAEEKLATLKRQLALRAARQHMLEAGEWLSQLPESQHSVETRSWQARIYILHHDWKKTLAVIDAMPTEERQLSNWLYWKARALEMTGRSELARPLYLLLANDRGYYSFLSSERLGVPLKFNHSGIEASPEEIKMISQLPAIQRAYEWLQLDSAGKASREWNMALHGKSRATWRAAATLATEWNWYDQAIRAAYKADENDALVARFPLGFEDAVSAASNESGLTTASIWSIIRQESAFNRQATSYVGAKGLMQLMPRTARGVAKKLNLGSSHSDLFSPKVNVRLGSAYLAEMNERFGNLALAAAAYNAGPHRVSLWVKRTPFDGAESWVEGIPFNETRRYVQQVMAFIAVYEWRQEKAPTSLIERIGGVKKVSLSEAR